MLQATYDMPHYPPHYAAFGSRVLMVGATWCVVVCCTRLQYLCVAVCCSVLLATYDVPHYPLPYAVLGGRAFMVGAVWCVAVCYSMLQYVAVCDVDALHLQCMTYYVFWYTALCCRMVQCVADHA